LIKDRDALLAFYDFPVEHWKHLRTTNVIENSFATVRRRRASPICAFRRSRPAIPTDRVSYPAPVANAYRSAPPDGG
jgi:transposase-like protein